MLKIELWGKKKLGYSFSTIIGGRQIVAIIVLKSGLARRVDPGPGTETGPSWRKNEGRKNPMWPSWPGGLTRQDPVKTRLQISWLLFFLFFLLKRRRFDLKKNWSGQNQEPDSWTRPCLKTMVAMTVNHSIHQKKMSSTQCFRSTRVWTFLTSQASEAQKIFLYII